jgi:hypothetical protein
LLSSYNTSCSSFPCILFLSPSSYSSLLTASFTPPAFFSANAFLAVHFIYLATTFQSSVFSSSR